jgi:membrane-associated protein
VALGCFGVPAPATVSLVVAGAFVASGDLALAPVLAVGFVGAIIGDQAGYWAGVSGSRWAERLQGAPVRGDAIARARASSGAGARSGSSSAAGSSARSGRR